MLSFWHALGPIDVEILCIPEGLSAKSYHVLGVMVITCECHSQINVIREPVTNHADQNVTSLFLALDYPSFRNMDRAPCTFQAIADPTL